MPDPTESARPSEGSTSQVSAADRLPLQRRRYSVGDGSEDIFLIVRQGLVGPPFIDMHRPLVGTVRYFNASMYFPEVEGAIEEVEDV